MSDWLNKWYTLAMLFMILGISFIPLSAACINDTCDTKNYSCHSLPATSSDQIDEVVSDRSFYEEDALACLSTIVESGFSAVKSVSQFVRKHPLKALTMFLALQNSSSPCRMAGADALSATNINQELDSFRNGPAVPFKPIMISSQADRLSIDFSFTSKFCDMCNIVSTLPVPPLSMTISGVDSVWSSQGNKASLNTLLSRLFFMPGGSSTKVGTIIVDIRELDAPYLTTLGKIDLRIYGINQDFVVNINQTLAYDVDGQAVRLLPMVFRATWAHANATIALGDELSGTLTSNTTILPQTFTAGT